MSALNFVIGNRAPNGAVALKCDIWGAAIGATAQHISDAINFFNVKNTNEANAQMQHETNLMNAEQARLNREFQAKMNRENNVFAADQARIQREWDSAQKQIARLRAAGLNPAVLYGQGNGAAAAGSASLATPHGSGVSPSMPTLTAPHFEAFQMASPVAAFKDMAQAFAELSQSDKTSAEAEMLKKGMADSLRSLKANADSAEIGRDLELLFAGQEKQLNIQRQKVEIAKSTQQAFNLAKEGNLIEARTVLTRQQEKSEKALANLRGEQARVAKNDADTYFNTLEARLKNLASSTAANNAQARFTSSQNEELQKMMDYNVQIRQNQAQMSQAEVMKQGAVLYDEIDYLLGHFENLSERERAELQQVKAAADAAKWNYDMRWVNWSLNTIERINNGVNKWAPWSFSRTDHDYKETYDTPDGSRVTEQTHRTGYQPSWHK